MSAPQMKEAPGRFSVAEGGGADLRGPCPGLFAPAGGLLWGAGGPTSLGCSFDARGSAETPAAAVPMFWEHGTDRRREAAQHRLAGKSRDPGCARSRGLGLGGMGHGETGVPPSPRAIPRSPQSSPAHRADLTRLPSSPDFPAHAADHFHPPQGAVRRRWVAVRVEARRLPRARRHCQRADAVEERQSAEAVRTAARCPAPG